MTALPFRDLTPYYRVHQGRKAGHPTVGQRLAGRRENHPHGGEIYSRNSCFGQVYVGGIDACWYPMHDARFDRAGCWSVSIDAQGHYTYWTAVQDDFGNLVAVQ